MNAKDDQVKQRMEQILFCLTPLVTDKYQKYAPSLSFSFLSYNQVYFIWDMFL